MKISISNIAWNNEEENDIAQLLQDIGLKGIDVAYTKRWPSPADASPEGLRAYRQFWTDHGLSVIGMQSLIYGRPDLTLFGDEATRTMMINYLIEVFSLAGQLGAGPLVFGSPKNRLKGSLTDEAAMRIAADFFSTLADAAQQEHITLCIEPNPSVYGCDFVQTTAPAIELVRAVNHPCFRLHLDSAIMSMNHEAIEPALESAIEYLAHFHVSEPQLGVVGAGTVDHPVFAAALRRLGYQGWVAIEMRNGWMPANRDAVLMALRYTHEVYGD